MQNFLVLCSILFQLSACGKPNHIYKRAEMLGGDSHLVGEYYTQMAYFADENVGPGDDLKVISVQYGPLTNTILGLCSYRESGRIITLRYDLMNNPVRRRLILTHEMTHCTQNLGHFDADIDIMNTVSANEQEKEDHWDFYFHKLCQRILGVPK